MLQELAITSISNVTVYYFSKRSVLMHFYEILPCIKHIEKAAKVKRKLDSEEQLYLANVTKGYSSHRNLWRLCNGNCFLPWRSCQESC